MDAGLQGVRGGEQALRGLPLLTCGLFWQSPLHSPLDSSRSTRHHGLVERVQRDPRRMVSPLRRYARHISFTEGLRSLAGGGVGFLGSSWWEKGLEVLSSPILQKLLFPVSLKSDVWPFCQRWLAPTSLCFSMVA